MENRKEVGNKLQQLYFKYSYCIFKIFVQDEIGDKHTGTGFHIGNGLIVTARHAVEKMKIISIEAEGPTAKIEIKKIHLPNNIESDVAVLETNFTPERELSLTTYHLGDKKVPAKECKASYLPIQECWDDWVGSELVLSKCIILGYPPIPTSRDVVLVAVSADVSAIVDSYLRPHVHYILSNVPRGGFSGAPVISEYDFVLGIVTTALTSNDEPVQLGFCGAVSVEPLFSLLMEKKLRPPGVSDEFWGNGE